jgi:hypothetical protein
MGYADIASVVASGDIGTRGESSSKPLNWKSILATGAGGLAGLLSGNETPKPTGYQGKVPVYQAVRQQVPVADRSAPQGSGGMGRQYFTNTQYLPRAEESGIATALSKAQQQSDAIAQANSAPTQGQRIALLNAAQSLYPMYTPYASTPAAAPARDSASADAGGSYDTPYNPNDASNAGGAAQGGLIGLARGGSTSEPRFLAGGTDGMADKIPATIEGTQPAKLGHGEFVIPADVVGFLGSGNSEAGAKVLYSMMDRIRKNAHGSKKQIKPANLKKTLPA